MTLLDSSEPPAFEVIEGQAADRLVLVCDHASNRIPKSLHSLGLPDRRLGEHIAWDIGAAGVVRELQRAFDASAVIAAYSRLVVDLNRSLADSSAFPVISDGVLIPGNVGIRQEDRAQRAAELYQPYHDAISRIIGSKDSRRGPLFVAIHSFTPQVHGTARPWHTGVLWDKDPRAAIPMLQSLRAQQDIVVGDNEPYSGRHPADYSIDFHAEAAGLAHVGIEIRQDLIEGRAGQERWAEILAAAIESVLANDAVFDRRPPTPGS